MSVFTSLFIIILAMVIQVSLELSTGVFAIFYHNAQGNTSAKKADDRALSFILGIEICIAIVFLLTYFVISFFAIEKNFMNSTFLWIMSGIFLVESFLALFWYYRPARKHSNSTKLFLSRKSATSLIHHAEHAKNRSDTIALGIITSAAELLFTLPLYIICSVEILNISATSGFIFIIAYIVIATIPLFAIRTFFHSGHNLAEIQRIRVKKKPFTKATLFICYLLLTIIVFVTGITK